MDNIYLRAVYSVCSCVLVFRMCALTNNGFMEPALLFSSSDINFER